MKFNSNPKMVNLLYDVCIIGAGASGLMTANVILRYKPDCKILIIESKDKPGRKIAASGNGKCNLSNIRSDGWSETSAFFEYLGVLTKPDREGRIYPYSEYAPDIVEALIAKLGKADFLLSGRATGVDNIDGIFHISAEHAIRGEKPRAMKLRSRRLVLACGGTASPQLGTCGDGFALAKQLAHEVREPVPALCGVRTEQNMKKLGLAGVRQKAQVSLEHKGNLLMSESGELQFTDYGLSGICIFNLTRGIRYEDALHKKFDGYRIKVDFMPEYSSEQVSRHLKSCDNSLRTILKPQLAHYIETKSRKFSALTSLIKGIYFDVTGLCDWDKAQVTRGGIKTGEFNTKTMESRKKKGLYFVGEIVDFDGPCGGFNLQNAWTCGIKCGKAISRYLSK